MSNFFSQIEEEGTQFDVLLPYSLTDNGREVPVTQAVAKQAPGFSLETLANSLYGDYRKWFDIFVNNTLRAPELWSFYDTPTTSFGFITFDVSTPGASIILYIGTLQISSAFTVDADLLTTINAAIAAINGYTSVPNIQAERLLEGEGFEDLYLEESPGTNPVVKLYVDYGYGEQNLVGLPILAVTASSCSSGFSSDTAALSFSNNSVGDITGANSGTVTGLGTDAIEISVDKGSTWTVGGTYLHPRARFLTKQLAVREEFVESPNTYTLYFERSYVEDRMAELGHPYEILRIFTEISDQSNFSNILIDGDDDVSLSYLSTSTIPATFYVRITMEIILNGMQLSVSSVFNFTPTAVSPWPGPQNVFRNASWQVNFITSFSEQIYFRRKIVRTDGTTQYLVYELTPSVDPVPTPQLYTTELVSLTDQVVVDSIICTRNPALISDANNPFGDKTIQGSYLEYPDIIKLPIINQTINDRSSSYTANRTFTL